MILDFRARPVDPFPVRRIRLDVRYHDPVEDAMGLLLSLQTIATDEDGREKLSGAYEYLAAELTAMESRMPEYREEGRDGVGERAS